MSHSPTSSNTTGTTPSSDSQRSTATSLETSSSRTTPTAVSPDFKHLEDQNNELLRENKQLKVDIASATSRAKTRYKERQDALHANRRLQTALDYEERERKGERKSLDLQLSLHKDIIAKLQQNSQQHASVNDDQLQACRERITQLEAENLAQSSKITDLEKTSSEDKTLVDKIRKTGSAMLLKMKLRLNKTEEHRQRLEAEVTEEKAKVTKLEAEIKNMIEEAKREKPGVSSLTGMQTSNKLNKRLLYPQSDSAQMAVEMNKRRKTHENGGFIHTTPPQHHYSNASASSASDMSSTPSKAAPWPLMQQAQSTMPSSGQTQLNAAPPQMDSRQLMANMGPRRAFKQSIPSVESMTPAHQPPLIRMRTPSFSSLGSNQNAPRFPTQMIHPTQNAMGQMLQRNILHMQQSQQGSRQQSQQGARHLNNVAASIQPGHPHGLSPQVSQAQHQKIGGAHLQRPQLAVNSYQINPNTRLNQLAQNLPVPSPRHTSISSQSSTIQAQVSRPPPLPVRIPTRVACIHCHQNRWNDFCDDGTPCFNCISTLRECGRARCEKFALGTCHNQRCDFAHEGDTHYTVLADINKALKKRVPVKEKAQSPAEAAGRPRYL